MHNTEKVWPCPFPFQKKSAYEECASNAKRFFNFRYFIIYTKMYCNVRQHEKLMSSIIIITLNSPRTLQFTPFASHLIFWSFCNIKVISKLLLQTQWEMLINYNWEWSSKKRVGEKKNYKEAFMMLGMSCGEVFEWRWLMAKKWKWE
jgi:hypothetical protein